MPAPTRPTPQAPKRHPHGRPAAGALALSALLLGMAHAAPRAAAPAPLPAASASAADTATRCSQPEPAPAEPPDTTSPRTRLLALLALAESRSKAVGAARLLADAARADLEEARSSHRPQASASVLAGAAGTQGPGWRTQDGLLRPALTVSAPLYDGGRLQALARWREQLLEAAHQGQLGSQEQVVLQTAGLALEHSRQRLHIQVWGQYTQRLCQLVGGLETIVASDRGRASELAQARKTLEQVQLSRSQAQTQLQLTETRLRRFVGPDLPSLGSLSALLLEAPTLDELMARSPQQSGVAGLAAQAQAAAALTQAVQAGQGLQASWQLTASKNLAGDRSGAWNAGISLSLPLLQPGAEAAARSARQRAEAAQLQRDEALESLQNRLTELHQQAGAALRRARDVAQVLRASERVREDTLLMWQQLGRRSLFDVIATEGEHHGLRLAYIDALHEGQQAHALLWSLAGGVATPLR